MFLLLSVQDQIRFKIYTILQCFIVIWWLHIWRAHCMFLFMNSTWNLFKIQLTARCLCYYYFIFILIFFCFFCKNATVTSVPSSFHPSSIVLAYFTLVWTKSQFLKKDYTMVFNVIIRSQVAVPIALCFRLFRFPVTGEPIYTTQRSIQ